jgi:tetratricopeptide (TPR) repeat protein
MSSDPLRAAERLLAEADDELNRSRDPARLLDQARSESDEAVRLAPADPAALRVRAVVLLKRASAKAVFGRNAPENWDAAIAAFDVAIGRSPGDLPLLLDRSHTWAMRAQCESDCFRDPMPDCARAIADAEKALEIEPDSAIARCRRADAHHVRAERMAWLKEDAFADAVRAITDYDDAIARGFRNVESLLNRAWAHRVHGIALERRDQDPVPAYDRALADIDEAIRMAPDRAPAYGQRATLLQHKGSALAARGGDPFPLWEEAIANLGETVTRSGRDDPRAFVWRANLRIGIAVRESMMGRTPMGQLLKALADCGEALDLNRDLIEAYEVRGGIWKLKAEYERQSGVDPKPSFQRAIADAQAALDRGSRRWSTFMVLGDALEGLGRRREAARAHQVVLRTGDLDPQARAYLEARIRNLLADGEGDA